MKLFIFGSTGDLVKRKVMRALQELDKPELEIYAIGRRELDKEAYRNFICSDWCRPEFRKNLHYLKIEFDKFDFNEFRGNMDKKEINYFYISLPPFMQKKAFLILDSISREGYKIQILSEKPFGGNLKEALELSKIINRSSLKKSFFISDHYLFKGGFPNLSGDFRKIKIVSLEELGLEGRNSYYDSVGALRDMVQSHFLNLLMKNLNFKVNLSEIKILDFVKGQYIGYEEELGNRSNTETFIYLKFNCREREFEFATGKAMDKKKSFIEIDNKRFEAGEDNSYMEIFRRFFNSEMKDFPSIKDSILGWKIIEEIEKLSEKRNLVYYKKGSKLKDVLEKRKNS